MPPEERDLIEAFQEGDEFAFVALYNRYKDAVYGFCLKMLQDDQLAQDLMQETFLRVYENRDRLMKAGAFKSWMFTIARNQCLNQLRRDRREVSLEEGREPEPPFAKSPGPMSQLEKSERIDLVNRCLDQLKPSYREVIILREYQNLSYKEIAAVTRSTLSAIKSRLFKARRKLAGILEPILEQEEGSAAKRQRVRS